MTVEVPLTLFSTIRTVYAEKIRLDKHERSKRVQLTGGKNSCFAQHSLLQAHSADKSPTRPQDTGG
jgi:hypothetical protein